MRYLVTGAAGFIGSNVAQALVERGDSVVGIDDFNNYYDPKIKERNASMLEEKGVVIFRTDITDKSEVERIFSEKTPQRVIHLAARAGVRPSLADPHLYMKVNIEGTSNILEAARKNGIRQVVIASSSSVYGERQNVPFSEDDDTSNPISPYAATKKTCEIISHAYSVSFGMQITCLRFFTVYGPRGRPDMAPYKFIRSIMEGKPIDVYGDGSTMRDYTYVDDVVAGVIAASDKPHDYAVLNIGNSSPVTLNEFITTIENAVGKKAIINRFPLQPGDVSKTYADISKAKELLGWQPKTSLAEGIRKTVDHMREALAREENIMRENREQRGSSCRRYQS